jgi:hypothetical protein
MIVVSKQTLGLYVDRATQQWVVRDPDGEFWVLPSVDDAWNHRQPFELTDDTELEPIPGHYKCMLQLPY